MTRAFVCGCRGAVLDEDERRFLRDAAPLGVILFGRNVQSPGQVAVLTAEIRESLGRDDALVLVDQEGGRVQRLGPPHWRRYPAAAGFSAIPDLRLRERAIRIGARLIAHDLQNVGIDVDCLPVLDVPAAGAHEVIGARAYADEPTLVARLGRAAAQGLLDGGILPVMKHVPGHGRANVDSHLELPTVRAPLSDLARSDFEPFRLNNDLPAAMTAHVVYADIDPDLPATISPTVITRIVRETIGFEGLLFSDDLSMKALPGTFRQKTERLFAAGVDVALHCNGDLTEAAAVAEAAPPITGRTAERLLRARAAMSRAGDPFDPVDAAAEFDRLLADVG